MEKLVIIMEKELLMELLTLCWSNLEKLLVKELEVEEVVDLLILMEALEELNLDQVIKRMWLF